MKAARPDLSVIIVSHNAVGFLPATLDSLHSQKGLRIETIVVDNASTDDTLALLKKEYPWVTVIQRKTNVGFSAGNNAGVKAAASDMILFCNPDVTFIHESDLNKCLDEYKRHQHIGFLTARVNLFANGQLDQTCHRGFPTPWAAFTHFSGLEKLFPTTPLFTQYVGGGHDMGKTHPVDAIGGMFMLVSRTVGDRVRWWDEAYPFYGEDLDFCYRVHVAGYKNIYYPGVTVLHHKGATTGMSKSSSHVTSASRATTRQVKEWSIQAMEIFYRKHYQDKYPLAVTWLVMAGIRLLRLVRIGLG